MLIQQRRDERVDREGLPLITYKNSGAFTLWSIDFTTDTKTKNYAPMDTIKIINKHATVDLPYKINDGAIADDEVQASSNSGLLSAKANINKITLDGSGGTFAAGDIIVQVSKQALTDDEYRRRQASTPLKKLLSIFGL